MTKIKKGKEQACRKRLMRFGFSKEVAAVACAQLSITDKDEWGVGETKNVKSGFETKSKKKKKTGFEPEEEVPKELEVQKEKAVEEWKERTPAGGKGAAPKTELGKTREVHTDPKAFQLPLYQPWRSPKSQHRLQTKLEKLQTQEEKFLTMEQLFKRSEYATSIKKRDSGEMEITYTYPEEIWEKINKEIEND